MTAARIRSILLFVFCIAAILPAQAAEVAHPTWTVPEGWQKQEGERPMRVATFLAGEAEIAVSQFAGNAGGLLANVNRWRGQVGLPPVTEDQLAETTQAVEVPGFAGSTMRLKGPEKHLLGAALSEAKADRTWFIKLTTTPAIADQQEAAFLAFVRSFVAVE